MPRGGTRLVDLNRGRALPHRLEESGAAGVEVVAAELADLLGADDALANQAGLAE
jgi:hypothetical protein